MTAPDITIPDEALEAAAKDLYEQERDLGGRSLPSWEDASPTTKRRVYKAARASCLAMLRAWPGMHEVDHRVTAQDEVVSFSIVLPIILPLPTENANAEA